tara:strand:+ start:1177 stop:2124 length:948 start_codon:yes stop_codon:yes gene_type:complete
MFVVRAVYDKSKCSGLKWRDIGSRRPLKGTELTNEELSKALQTKLEFSPVEWDAFAVRELKMEHFVEAGGRYFQPNSRDPQSIGAHNLLNIVFGANTWKCSSYPLHSTFLWLPLFYIESTKGHTYIASLILQCILATFATISMAPIVDGDIIKTTDCCSSYTYYFILGAFFAQIPFEILEYGVTNVSLVFYLVLTLMVSLTHIYLSQHVIPSEDRLGGQFVGSAVLTVYILFVTFFVVVLRLFNQKQNKTLLAVLYSFIFITIFLYTIYQERDDTTTSHVNMLHHAAPFLFAGLYVLFLQIYLARKHTFSVNRNV